MPIFGTTFIQPTHDAIVVGGGFYGCCLASFFAKSGQNVALLEAEDELLTRASYINQARVHNGYHYPRSFMTALRSVVNFPRFVLDFKDCVADGFEKVYAIARSQSKVSAYQFRKFCQNIGAPIRPAPSSLCALFNSSLIESVYCVKECAFDASRLRTMMMTRLHESAVDVRLGVEAMQVRRAADGILEVCVSGGGVLRGRCVFNCTYSQINQLLRHSGLEPLLLKHELTELALIEPPAALRNLGVTVMDGPFFSTMPFPPQKLHSLSHVRYTPHEAWVEPREQRDPHAYLKAKCPESNCAYMLRDAKRYLPILGEAKHARSLFTIKTVLVQNEADDGRPIMLRWHPELGGMATVMGGKIDNIYDVLSALGSLHKISKTPVPLDKE